MASNEWSGMHVMEVDLDRQRAEAAIPLYQAIQETVRSAILAGRLDAGDVLTEVAVAAVLETSRTPVKLAFDRLVEDGLMAKAEGRGFVVTRPGAPAGEPRRRIGRDAFAALMDAPPPRRSRAAWTTIYDEVEREVSGRSVFGRLRVIETELAQAYEVSRTVAHEVLMRLERLGIVEKDTRNRWLIVPMTPERVRQIYEVRRLLEPAAIRAAATRIHPAEIESMLRRLQRLQEKYPKVSVEELDSLERDLHVDCVGHCGNAELMKLLRGIQVLLIHSKHMLGSYLSLPQLDPFMAEHETVLAALARRDGAGAAEAMEAHLRAAMPNVLQRLDALLALPQAPLPRYLVPE